MSNMLNPGVYQLTQLLLTSPSVVFIHVYHGALQRTERTGRSWDTEPTDSCSESGSSAGESRRQTGAPGGKTQQSLCDADCFTVRRGAQRECFKLLGSKRGFIFTPASTFCSNNEEIMEPWTGQTRTQSLFLKLLGLKSGFIFTLASQPVCSSDPQMSPPHSTVHCRLMSVGVMYFKVTSWKYRKEGESKETERTKQAVFV